MYKIFKLTTLLVIFFLLIPTGLELGDEEIADGETEAEGKVELAAFKIEEFADFFRVLILLICLCLFKMFYPLLPYVPEYIPQSLLLIVSGVIFGTIYSRLDLVLENSVFMLTPEIFFHFLLPPIILDASYGLCNRTFFDFLSSILIYAVLGTVLNFLIIGFLMFGLVKATMPDEAMFELKSILLFASLIVAVDPVAVLAIFEEIGVEPGLYYMVFGESLLNDAVTVVLYRIMSQFVGMEIVSGSNIGLGIGSFFTISIGGLLVGVVYGVFTSLLTRWKSHFASIFVILLAYFSYIMGECVGWSGIIAMIGCALVQAEYAFHNMSEPTLTALRKIVKQIAEISEGLIFFLIGAQLFSAEIVWNTGFCLWGLFTCLVARTLVVLFLSFIMNIIRVNKLKISFREQLILIYGGLRGAVALGLSLLVEERSLGTNGVFIKKNIVTGTLFVILVTIGLMGLTMKPLVRLFKVKLANELNLSIWQDLNDNVLDHVLAGTESIIGSKGRNSLRRFFINLDDKYFRKVLQRDPDTHAEKIVKTYEEIALKLHYGAIKRSNSASNTDDIPELLARRHLSETDFNPNESVYHYNIDNDEISKNPGSMTFRRKSSAKNLGDPNFPHPKWTSRPSIINQENIGKEFDSVFLGMMEKKRILSKIQEIDEHSTDDIESDRVRESNEQIDKKSKNVNFDEKIVNYPAKDYKKNTTKFDI